MDHGALVLIEIGALLLGIALLGRLAGRLGISSIPLILLAGLAFGEGGLLPFSSGEEFIDAGDSVVVRVNQQATGPESRAPVGMRYYQIWTFRGKSVIRIESVRERPDALEAVGLSD